MSNKDLKLKNNLSKEFINGLYKPEFIPQDINVADFLRTSLSDADIQKNIKAKEDNPPHEAAVGMSRKPLTKEEAKEVDRQIANTVNRIDLTRQRIADVKLTLDQEMSGFSASRGSEVNFTLDIRKKPRIKRAIRKLFGRKTNTITYSMYKELLAAKVRLEEESSDEYLNGWDTDELA